jgi:hypothetical protein
MERRFLYVLCTVQRMHGSDALSSVVAKPALVSAAIALAVEVPMCLILSFAAVKPFARYLGGSSKVAAITEHMWKTFDWVRRSLESLDSAFGARNAEFAPPFAVLHPLRRVNMFRNCTSRYKASLMRLTLLFSVDPALTRRLQRPIAERYLGQSLLANIGYCLPWAIIPSLIEVAEGSAWTYHAIVFVSRTCAECQARDRAEERCSSGLS